MKHIQRRISIECLTGRLPALFAYFEWDEYGNPIKTNAFAGEQGCYGKVVCNIRIPNNVNGTEIEGIVVGNVYTYSTLMSLYYQYSDDHQDDPFIVFMATAIGKIDIDLDRFKRDQDLVPAYVYLGNAKHLLDWYMDRKALCDRYNESGVFNKHICCKCEEYYRSGGDIMLEILRDLVNKARRIADEYIEYAVDDAQRDEDDDDDEPAKGVTICVDLDQTIDDLGLDSLYLNEWIGGKSYVAGEVITYGENGIYHSYEVKENINALDSYNKDTEKYDFSLLIRKGKVVCNEKMCEQRLNTPDPDEATLQFTSDSKLKTLRKFTGNVFDCTESDKPDDDEDWLIYYCPGYITEYTSLNDDYGNIRLMDDNMVTETVGDKTIVTNLYLYGSGIKSISFEPDEKKIIFEYYINTHLNATLGNITIGDDGVTKYYYEDMFIKDKPDSGVRYVDEYRYEEGGEIDEKVGGTPRVFTTPEEFYDFFKEELIDDNNTPDESDDVVVENNEIAYTRYSFSTQSRQTSFTAYINGKEIYASYTWADGKRTNNLAPDMFNVHTFKKDYYYGVAYAPDRETDVMISRGNASAFERHIRLSEVKTMEDLENYANGGYYNIANLNG